MASAIERTGATSEYDTDAREWSERQSALLRRLAAGENINDRIDWSDEMEAVGRSKRALREAISRWRRSTW
jgi:hypothetical protein